MLIQNTSDLYWTVFVSSFTTFNHVAPRAYFLVYCKQIEVLVTNEDFNLGRPSF